MVDRLARLIGVVAILGFLTVPGQAVHAGEPPSGIPGGPTGDLRFDVTLSGPVDPADTFSLGLGCDTTNECIFIELSAIICTGDAQQRHDWGYPVCGPGTFVYERPEMPVGSVVHYGLARVPDSIWGSGQSLLSGTVVVPEGGITIHLGYVYQDPATLTALPDTAMKGP